MIADANAVVAVHRPSKVDGGTASALRKARARRLPVILIDPDFRTVTWPDAPARALFPSATPERTNHR